MSKIPQTTDELKRHLHENVAFLVSSCREFDAGVVAEAKRLATTLRVLLHDTSQSKSLLGLLGLKSQLDYMNTATPYDADNLLAHHGLVGLKFGPQGASYWAPLDKRPDTRPHVNFDDWWSELIISDKSGGNFTRKDVILALANKDGGAHVDPNLDPAYAALTRGNSVGWEFSSGETKHQITDIELYSVRQIAYELLQTLKIAGFNSA